MTDATVAFPGAENFTEIWSPLNLDGRSAAFRASISNSPRERAVAWPSDRPIATLFDGTVCIAGPALGCLGHARESHDQRAALVTLFTRFFVVRTYARGGDLERGSLAVYRVVGRMGCVFQEYFRVERARFVSNVTTRGSSLTLFYSY